MTKKELGSSTKKPTDNIASTSVNQMKTNDSRAESQPAKVTHQLTKQDSSKYLQANSHQVQPLIEKSKRIAIRATRDHPAASSVPRAD